MKIISICVLLFLGSAVFGQDKFGQDKDLQARYLYSRAEDDYSKSLYPEVIKLCEQAAVLLGSTNQKILFLELEAYSALLSIKCQDPLFSQESKITGYIHLYLDSLGKSADNEKVMAIIKFKDQWDKYEQNGCRTFTYKDLNLGLNFAYPVKSSYGKIWQITGVEDGAFKNQTGMINFDDKSLHTPIREGFLVIEFYIVAYYKDKTQVNSMILEAPNGMADNPGGIPSSEIPNRIDQILNDMQNHGSDILRFTVTVAGYYPAEGKKKDVVYTVAIPIASEY